MEMHDKHLFCVALTSCIYHMALFASIEPIPKGIIMYFLKFFLYIIENEPSHN